jgi:hypothetical protein
MKTNVLILLSLLLILSTACAKKAEDTEEYLEFSSGGDYHPSGCGQWYAKLLGDGSLAVTHIVRGETKYDDAFKLSDDETRRLFSLFCTVNIKSLKSSTRPGLPDEVRYDFTLCDGSGAYVKRMWINEARENKAVMDLVGYLEQLITKYSGQKPIMR